MISKHATPGKGPASAYTLHLPECGVDVRAEVTVHTWN